MTLYHTNASSVLLAKISLISPAYRYADINARGMQKLRVNIVIALAELGYLAGNFPFGFTFLPFVPDTINVVNEKNDYR